MKKKNNDTLKDDRTWHIALIQVKRVDWRDGYGGNLYTIAINYTQKMIEVYPVTIQNLQAPVSTAIDLRQAMKYALYFTEIIDRVKIIADLPDLVEFTKNDSEHECYWLTKNYYSDKAMSERHKFYVDNYFNKCSCVENKRFEKALEPFKKKHLEEIEQKLKADALMNKFKKQHPKEYAFLMERLKEIAISIHTKAVNNTK